MTDRDAKSPGEPGPEPAELAPTKPAEPASPRLGGERRFERLPRGTAVGRYFILDLVGEGGMGAVYSAYDPDLGRKVAIKLLKVDGAGAQEARGRLLREAQAMARLAHPNVLPVFDAGAFGDQLFVAMEFVEGGATLLGWLAQKRSPREILRKFLAAGEGLVAAHEKGLVHRDFKPENVLVGADGRPRVTDFGLAHVDAVEEPSGITRSAGDATTSARTIAGQISGTPAYMAPEQFLAAATDARTDQFCFCVALWEALCGERPFAGSELWEISRNVLAGQVRLSPRSKAIPKRLRAALLKGLSRRPEDRFASLADLLQVLRRDPLLAARHLVPWVLLALVVLGAASRLAWTVSVEETRCQREAAAERAALWTPERRGAMGSSFEAAGLPAAEANAALVELDDFFARHEATRRAVCEKARKSPQPGALECLRRHARQAQAGMALVSSAPLRRSDPSALISFLGNPQECLDQPVLPAQRADADLTALRMGLAQTGLLAKLGRHGEAAAEARVHLKEARERGAWAEAAQLERLLGSSLWMSQGTPGALEHYQASVRDSDASGDDELSFENRLGLLWFLALGEGRLDRAEEVALDCEAWLRRLGPSDRRELEYLKHRGILAAEQRRSEEALDLFRRAAALSEKLHGPLGTRTAYARNAYGTQLYRNGKLAEAEANLLAAIRAYEAAPYHTPLDHCTAWFNLGSVRLQQGRLDEALAALDRGDALLTPVREQAEVHRLWGELLRATLYELQGHLEQADRAYLEVLSHRDMLDGDSIAEALAGRARFLVAQGKVAEALPLAREAWALAQPIADNLSVGQAAFGLAVALRASGDSKGAQEMTQAALGQFAGPENAFMRQRIEQGLAGETGKNAPTPLPRLPVADGPKD